MFITKRSIPRRAFLRGTGVMAALPLLDAMVPALTAMSKTAAKPAIRLGFWNTANGVFGPDFKPTGGEGDALGTLSPILAPMEPLRDHMVVATGLSNVAAESKQVGSGVHARAASAYLSGMPAKRTEGGDIELGITLDQHAARVIGQETQLNSLELALESSLAGNCDQGYSCVYVNTFSWRTPTMPLPMENNPRVLFERMFGDGGTVEQRLGQLRKDRSVLDSMTDQLRKFQKALGTNDRNTVNGYLEAIRDVEQRIQKAEASSASTPLPETALPAGIPESFPEHAKLMVDLMFLAYQADITRVMTFQTSREQGGRQFPFIGVPEAHHQTSHHQGDLHLIAANTKINAYFMQLFADLCGKMKDTPDGDGTLLDHSMLLWGAALGSGDIHSPHDMPVMLAGSGGGQIKGGRLLNYEIDTPFMNFGLGMIQKAGVDLETLGDASGVVTNL